MSQSGLEALIELGGGDMRRVLNLLQSTVMSAGEVTEDSGEQQSWQWCGARGRACLKACEWYSIASDLKHGWTDQLTDLCCSPSHSDFQPCPALHVWSAYATAGKPLPQDIERCAHWLLNEPLSEAFRLMLNLQLDKGVALVDILQQLHP